MEESKRSVDSSDEDLEVKSQRMGYANFSGEALYVARLPCRRQRQGLSRENTYVCYPSNRTPQRQRMDAPPRRTGEATMDNISTDQLQSRAMYDMLMNEYPSFVECFKEINNKNKTVNSLAFGRKLLLMRDEIGITKIHYFTRPIGTYNHKRQIFCLSEDFEHYSVILKHHAVPFEINDQELTMLGTKTVDIYGPRRRSGDIGIERLLHTEALV